VAVIHALDVHDVVLDGAMSHGSARAAPREVSETSSIQHRTFYGTTDSLAGRSESGPNRRQFGEFGDARKLGAETKRALR